MALDKAARDVHEMRSGDEDSSMKPCEVDGCLRPAKTRNMCSAHYSRHRQGKPLTGHIRSHQPAVGCADCGKQITSKGGWGRCNTHYKRKRYQVVKQAVILAMGGVCERCLLSFPMAAYDFHHSGELAKGAKTENPSYTLSSRSVAEIAEELHKCVLLCSNCHRLEHTYDV